MENKNPMDTACKFQSQAGFPGHLVYTCTYVYPSNSRVSISSESFQTIPLPLPKNLEFRKKILWPTKKIGSTEKYSQKTKRRSEFSTQPPNFPQTREKTSHLTLYGFVVTGITRSKF